MKVTPVYGKPALLLEGKERYTVIADLHVGIEREWMRKISRRILERMKGDITEILKERECENLIILGDLKHTVEGVTREDERVIRSFLEDLSSISNVLIVKGNHDGGIEEISPEGIEIKDARGFRIEKAALLHGHASPNEDVLSSEIILTAHIHPVISFRERSGLRI
ncbi:MAG: metallophosphoesterase family protein, partial [Archaeoglobi archaeon]|nr:metallophosphoesterase family protein [Candidatus Mnemosynella bozhongmuii]